MTDTAPAQTQAQASTSTSGAEGLSADDEKVLERLRSGALPQQTLESAVAPDYERAVRLRREFLRERAIRAGHSCGRLDELPITGYPYEQVAGAHCENVIGFCTLPLGVAGPLLVDGRDYFVPLATTEGALVASTNRGCRAIALSASDTYATVAPWKGVRSFLLADGMTRAPVLRLPNAAAAFEARGWMLDEANWGTLKTVFESGSRHMQLDRVQVKQAGRLLYARFVARTGDAMGMNMVTRGTERAIAHLCSMFPDIEVVSLSGNMCSDKKPAAINWIEGRGKSVTCEAVIPAQVVRTYAAH